MASFLERMETLQILIPNPTKIDSAVHTDESEASPENFIDAHVGRRLQRLNILASPLCDDSSFLRRVFLDVIGTLPTPQEAREFLNDQSANKRESLVDQLLERPEYAKYWSLKWSDTLRVDRSSLGHKGA